MSREIEFIEYNGIEGYIELMKHDIEPLNNPECKKIELYYDGKDIKALLDYITNLQVENERLKQKLNCKEYFSSTMPENTEFVILTKQNYDRQQKDIELELIDYKIRNEKAVEYIKKGKTFETINVGQVVNKLQNDLLNILEGSDKE